MVRHLYEYLTTMQEAQTLNFGNSVFGVASAWLPDVLLYMGVMVVVVALGRGGNSLLRVSKTCLVVVLVILIIQVIPVFYSIGDQGEASLVQASSSKIIRVDAFTQIIKICIVSVVLVLYRMLGAHLYAPNIKELPLLLHIGTALVFTAISASNFALLLLAIEGYSLTLYILAASSRTYGGVTAAAKYFSFGTLGSVLLFWGVVHLYTIAPSLSYTEVSFLLEFSSSVYVGPIVDSLAFAGAPLMLGFLIKLGAAPLHAWVPDVYAGSAMVVTAYFSTAVKLTLFVLFCQVASHVVQGGMIEFCAISSLLVGSALTLRQVEIKRFIAYSSITHIGFLLIGDLPAALNYIVVYVCSSLLFFLVISSIRVYNAELLYLVDLRLIRGVSQWRAGALAIALMSMAGLPPFSGFFGKFLVWSSLVEDIYLTGDWLVFGLFSLSVVLTLVIIFYYMRLVVYLYVTSDIGEADENDSSVSFREDTCSFNQLVGLLVAVVTLWIALHSAVLSLVGYISYGLVG
jgi:NADH-quinone oxidoreductase subunit N